MKSTPFSSRPRRGFTRANVTLSMCALALASLTLASKAKEAFAYGPQDATCTNIIGTANCPAGWTNQGFTATINTTCHSSTAWYGGPLDGPYYSCCTYAQRFRQCYDPTNDYTQLNSVEYLRAKTSGSATCQPDPLVPGSHKCVYDI